MTLVQQFRLSLPVG